MLEQGEKNRVSNFKLAAQHVRDAIILCQHFRILATNLLEFNLVTKM